MPLTTHNRDAYLAGMMEAGAAGFLAKSEPDERLIAAIRCAACGEVLFDSKNWYFFQLTQQSKLLYDSFITGVNPRSKQTKGVGRNESYEGSERDFA